MNTVQFYRERLLATGRPGAAELVDFLITNHFFGSCCRRHHHWQGGTAQHSIEALLYAEAHNRWGAAPESMTIVCLLHDLCNLPTWHDFCHGAHGYRSARLATDIAGFPLTQEEYDAICHHMHGYSKPWKFRGRKREVTALPCWKMIREADAYSANNPIDRRTFRAEFS